MPLGTSRCVAVQVLAELLRTQAGSKPNAPDKCQQLEADGALVTKTR